MITPSEILCGICLPIIVGLAAMLALSRHKAIAAALSLGLGFAAGYALLVGAVVLRPSDQFHWIGWLVVAALAWGLLDSAFRIRNAVRLLVILAAGLAISANLLWPLTRSHWEGSTGYLWIAGTGAATAVSWGLLDAAARRTPGAAVSTVALLAATCAAGVLGASGSVAFAKSAGVLAASAGGVWLGGLLFRRESGAWMQRGAVAVFAVAYLGMIVNGRFWSELAWPEAGLLAIAPAALWLGHFTPQRWPAWKRHTVGAVAAAAMLLTAAALAGYAAYQTSQQSDPASMYGAAL